MYQVSRSLYRHLVPYLEHDAPEERRQLILSECEQTVVRVFEDPDFARPDLSLFDRVRLHFPIDEQVCVRRLIELHIALARELRERTPLKRERCPAFSRKDEPCQREPTAGRVYCPSHRHLEEPVVTRASEPRLGFSR